MSARFGFFLALLGLSWIAPAWAVPAIEVVPANDSAAVVIADRVGATTIAVDAGDYPVVLLAAGLFADDVQRVAQDRVGQRQ